MKSFIKNYLNHIFVEFKTHNPEYTYSDFALATNLSISSVSLILNGRQGISPAKASKIFKKFEKKEVADLYFLVIVSQYSKSQQERRKSQFFLDQALKLKVNRELVQKFLD